MPAPEPACTQQYRPAAKDGAQFRYVHHGNGTTDPHLYGAWFPGQGLQSELETGPTGASLRVDGFGASAVCASLAVDGVLPVPRGIADHSITLPREYTVDAGYRFRDPDYGNGVYAARLETQPILFGGVVTHDLYMRLAITVRCKMPDGGEQPVLYFLGNTRKVMEFLAGEEIVITNRLNCTSMVTSLFQTTAGRAIIRPVSNSA